MGLGSVVLMFFFPILSRESSQVWEVEEGRREIKVSVIDWWVICLFIHFANLSSVLSLTGHCG